MQQHSTSVLDQAIEAVVIHCSRLSDSPYTPPDYRKICFDIASVIERDLAQMKEYYRLIAEAEAAEFYASAREFRKEAESYKFTEPEVYTQIIREAEEATANGDSIRNECAFYWSEDQCPYNHRLVEQVEAIQVAKGAPDTWMIHAEILGANPNSIEAQKAYEIASDQLTRCFHYINTHGLFDSDHWADGISEIEILTELVGRFLKTGGTLPPTPSEKVEEYKGVKEGQPSFPSHCLETTGRLGQLCAWINSTAPRPQPILTLAASVTALAGFFGNRYSVEPLGTRLNMYVCGIAPTGSGKDHPRKCISTVFEAGGAGGYIMGSNVTSDAAILKALERNPSQFCQMDEIGLMLQELASNNVAAYKKGISATLMTLYSSSGGTHRGTEYADPNRKRVDIENPCLCIYGTSTKSELYKALSTADADSGYLNRWVIIEGDQKPALSQLNFDHHTKLDPPEELVASIHDVIAWRTFESNHTITVTVASEAQSALQEVWQFSQQNGPLWVRYFENTVKFAAVAAISDDHKEPTINLRHAEWARDLVQWCTQNMEISFKHNVSDSSYQHKLNRIHEIIRHAGDAGITLTELSRATSSYRADERNNILEHLFESELIAVAEEKSPRTHKPVKRFYAVNG